MEIEQVTTQPEVKSEVKPEVKSSETYLNPVNLDKKANRMESRIR
jgi:hypothetical protein